MPHMRGTVTIVQEGRFQMTADDGVSHLFTLGANSAAETQQLTALQRDQVRVRVRWTEGRNMIGNIAHTIEVDG